MNWTYANLAGLRDRFLLKLAGLRNNPENTGSGLSNALKYARSVAPFGELTRTAPPPAGLLNLFDARLRELAEHYSSAEAQNAYTAALAAQETALAGLIAEYNTAATNAAALTATASAAKSARESKGAEINALMIQLAGLSDPADIDAKQAEINAATAAYNALPPCVIPSADRAAVANVLTPTRDQLFSQRAAYLAALSAKTGWNGLLSLTSGAVSRVPAPGTPFADPSVSAYLDAVSLSLDALTRPEQSIAYRNTSKIIVNSAVQIRTLSASADTSQCLFASSANRARINAALANPDAVAWTETDTIPFPYIALGWWFDADYGELRQVRWSYTVENLTEESFPLRLTAYPHTRSNGFAGIVQPWLFFDFTISAHETKVISSENMFGAVPLPSALPLYAEFEGDDLHGMFHSCGFASPFAS